MRRLVIFLTLVSVVAAMPLRADVVNFYAWGGSSQVNSYLRWVQKELRAEGIQLRHNKMADASEVVAQLINGHSNADIVWINGENFHALKKAEALLPVADNLSVMTDINPELNWQRDFGEPVQGLEVPWGVGQFNLLAHPTLFSSPSVTAESLRRAAEQHPGRLSYPKPPDFHGTTFLKSLLLSLRPVEHAIFQRPVSSVDAKAVTAPLWAYLDRLHPLLWQKGHNFPSSAGEQISYLANGQLLMAVSFNPNDYLALVNQGRLPAGIERHRLSDAAITNTHYLAVPTTAGHPEQAKQVIKFLLSSRAQQRKADINGWGDPSVLKPELTSEFEQPALLKPADDFHSSWQTYLEQQWSARYQ